MPLFCSAQLLMMCKSFFGWDLQLILEFLLSEDAAKDAGPLMKAKLDEDGHSHSKAAFNMLQQFLVGSLEESPAGYVDEAYEMRSGALQWTFHSLSQT